MTVQVIIKVPETETKSIRVKESDSIYGTIIRPGQSLSVHVHQDNKFLIEELLQNPKEDIGEGIE